MTAPWPSPDYAKYTHNNGWPYWLYLNIKLFRNNNDTGKFEITEFMELRRGDNTNFNQLGGLTDKSLLSHDGSTFMVSGYHYGNNNNCSVLVFEGDNGKYALDHNLVSGGSVSGPTHYHTSGHSSRYAQVQAMTPDAKYIAVGDATGHNRRNHALYVFGKHKLSNGFEYRKTTRNLKDITSSTYPYAAVFSGDGRYLFFTGSSSYFYVYKAPELRDLKVNYSVDPSTGHVTIDEASFVTGGSAVARYYIFCSIHSTHFALSHYRDYLVKNHLEPYYESESYTSGQFNNRSGAGMHFHGETVDAGNTEHSVSGIVITRYFNNWNGTGGADLTDNNTVPFVWIMVNEDGNIYGERGMRTENNVPEEPPHRRTRPPTWTGPRARRSTLCKVLPPGL